MDKSMRGAAPLIAEERSFATEFEVRTSPTTSMVEVEGYASTFNEPYKMYDSFGEYHEMVRQGAFAKTLSERVDVPFLIDHGGTPHARTTNGSLHLEEDDHGLLSVAKLNMERQDTRDLVIAIRDGLMTEMSFGFRVVQQKWDDNFEQRDMIELNLHRGDVSAVKFGANPLTNIGVRNAFRSMKPAALHRAAAELRAGAEISTANRAILAKVLELAATADDAVDKIQPMLADLLGVPDPDADGEADDKARSLAYLDVLRRKHIADGERRTA